MPRPRNSRLESPFPDPLRGFWGGFGAGGRSDTSSRDNSPNPQLSDLNRSLFSLANTREHPGNPDGFLPIPIFPPSQFFPQSRFIFPHPDFFPPVPVSPPRQERVKVPCPPLVPPGPRSGTKPGMSRWDSPPPRDIPGIFGAGGESLSPPPPRLFPAGWTQNRGNSLKISGFVSRSGAS